MESYNTRFNNNTVTRVKGITLIELLAVLVIVSCLAALALPSYENVFKEKRLSQAKSTLLGLQLRLDKYLSRQEEYPQSADELVGIDTESSHYEFMIEHDRTCGSKWCYALVAIPKSQSRKDELLKLHSNGSREGNW